MTRNEIIGSNIKKYRKSFGYTQEKLAELLSISVVHVRRLEKGKCDPRASTLIKAARCFNISIDDLVGIKVLIVKTE